eukprot:scaffold927_cov230-Pinguiococcus_pyrenoidosus.AAC.2
MRIATANTGSNVIPKPLLHVRHAHPQASLPPLSRPSRVPARTRRREARFPIPGGAPRAVGPRRDAGLRLPNATAERSGHDENQYWARYRHSEFRNVRSGPIKPRLGPEVDVMRLASACAARWYRHRRVTRLLGRANCRLSSCA